MSGRGWISSAHLSSQGQESTARPHARHAKAPCGKPAAKLGLSGWPKTFTWLQAGKNLCSGYLMQGEEKGFFVLRDKKRHNMVIEDPLI